MNSDRLKLYHRALLLSLVLLIIVYAYMTMINPVAQKSPNLVIFLLHTLPLLTCIFVVLKQNYRGFMWVSFISLMLFCVATANVFAGYGWVVYLEIALTVLIFMLSLLAGSYYKKHHKAAALANASE